MAVRVGDKVAYHTRSGEMRTGVVTRKTGQGMVDIRLDGSGRTVRQEGRSLSRMRTNGRARRNIGDVPTGKKESEDRWYLPLATMLKTGVPAVAGAPALGVALKRIMLDAEKEGWYGTELEQQKLLEFLREGPRRAAVVHALEMDGLADPDITDSDLYDLLREMLPAANVRRLEIYKRAFEGTKEKVEVQTGLGVGSGKSEKAKTRSERRRERRYVQAEALKQLRKQTAGQDIFERIQQQRGAVRILPDPVRTNRAGTFICGNVLDGHAYTLNTTAQPRFGSHWLTYGDLGLEYRDGRLAYDPKKANYLVKMTEDGTPAQSGSFKPLTLENFAKIKSLKALVSKRAFRPKDSDQPGKTYISVLGGRDKIRPFDVVPLAVHGDLSPILGNAVNSGEGRYRSDAEDPARPQEVEALQHLFEAMAKSQLLKADVPSGFHAPFAVPVGITNVGAAWVKSKGSKSAVYDEKSGGLRGKKIQGGRSGGLYPNTALPAQLPTVRVGGRGETVSIPDNRITPDTPVLFMLPRSWKTGKASGDFEYALDMESEFRTYAVVGIRTDKTKDITAQTVRNYFQVYAPNSPKDRDPYFSWVPERPGQFPDVTQDTRRVKEVFDRPCPEPKELEYLEAIRQAAGALSGVISSGFGLRRNFNGQINIGTKDAPHIAQASTIFLRNGNTVQEKKADRARGYLASTLNNLTYGLSRLSIQHDRIEESKQIRPYRGQKAADYTIFDDPTLLDHLLPAVETRNYVHTAIVRIREEIKHLIDAAVKRRVLVEEKRVTKATRRKKAADRKTYTIRKAVRDFVPFPAGTVTDFLRAYSKQAGWDASRVLYLWENQFLPQAPSLNEWRVFALPKNKESRDALLTALGSQSGAKEFSALVRRMSQDSFAKFLEVSILGMIDVSADATTLVVTDRVNNYSKLMLAMIGLTCYRPDDMTIGAKAVNDLYMLSFEQLVIALLKWRGRTEEAQELLDLLGRDRRLPGIQRALEPRERFLELGRSVIEQAFQGDDTDCMIFLNYLYWRANANAGLRGWGGQSNYTFGQAVALYLALDLEKPDVVGPISDEQVYGATQTDLVEIMKAQALKEEWERDALLAVLLRIEQLNEAYYRRTGTKGRTSIAQFSKDELDAVKRVLDVRGVGEPSFVEGLYALHDRLVNPEGDDLSASSQTFTVLSRVLRESLKIAVAGGHGIEDASRLTRSAQGRPIRINGYYTYNPLLFEFTRTEYKNVTTAEESSKVPFGGFYLWDKKNDKAVWKHQDIADRMDQLGYYAKLLFWARTAALQHGNVRTEEDLQEAWNDYWDRIVEAGGPDSGQELAASGGTTVFVPFAYTDYTPRTFLQQRKTKRGIPYYQAADTFRAFRNDLFGTMRLVKDAYYLPAMDRAAGFIAEGLYPEGSQGGPRGKDEKKLIDREKFGSGNQQSWISKLGTVLFQLREALASKAAMSTNAGITKARKILAQPLPESTDDPQYVATMAAAAAAVLGVDGVTPDPAWLKSNESKDAIGELIRKLYDFRSVAGRPPSDLALKSYRSFSTDDSYLTDTHLAVAQSRRAFKNNLLRIIDEKIEQLSSP